MSSRYEGSKECTLLERHDMPRAIVERIVLTFSGVVPVVAMVEQRYISLFDL
jgi:hypothetical protein